MLVKICMKFHEGNLNCFWVTERTRPYRKIYYFQFRRAKTPKIHNPELRFLRSACRLVLLYICVKFHEIISNSFWVTGRTRFCDQTDRQPGQKQYVSQPYGGWGGGGVRHNSVMRVTSRYPEWWKFQFAPNNHYGFFFKHTLPSTIRFNLEYALFYRFYATITTFSIK